MRVLVVTFELNGITEPQYRQGCDEGAEAFAEIPGLIAKVWLADAGNGRFGGVYTFEDDAALDAYLASDLFRAVAEAPEFADVRADSYGVLESPTRVTHGWAAQPV